MKSLFEEVKPAPIYLELCAKVDKNKLMEAALTAYEAGFKEGLEEVRQEARQEVLREARQEMRQIQTSAAVTLLKMGVPHETIREDLKVSEKFLLNLEKKLKLKMP
ncbi:MAG: hypothetical protein LBE27_00285 [Deltaproteobacteria bacterium]|nr:hypothetical protein [Deltaproteobacteria bacterium]